MGFPDHRSPYTYVTTSCYNFIIRIVFSTYNKKINSYSQFLNKGENSYMWLWIISAKKGFNMQNKLNITDGGRPRPMALI